MNNLNDIFFAPAANQDLTYDQVLEDVQRYFAENHASTIAEAGEGNAERATTLLKELMVQYIVKRKYAIEGLTTEELCEKLYEDTETIRELTGEEVEPAECSAVLSRRSFDAAFSKYVEWHAPDPSACTLRQLCLDLSCSQIS